MSYNAVVLMAASQSLRGRIIAASAATGLQGISPQQFVDQHLWTIISHDSGWADAWQYAVDNLTINQNPDIGVRTDVISDEMIDTEVAAVADAKGNRGQGGGQGQEPNPDNIARTASPGVRQASGRSSGQKSARWAH